MQCSSVGRAGMGKSRVAGSIPAIAIIISLCAEGVKKQKKGSVSMSIKLIVKIGIASAILVLYKIIHGVSYIEMNSLAVDQLQNSNENFLALQAYIYVLNYSWMIVAILFLLLFCEDIINLIKWIKEKINETY